MGGAKKALLPIDGRRIINRQLDVLAPRFDEVLLVVADPLGWDVPRTRLVVDRAPHQGPLAGLQAALEEAGDVFVVACDLPFLDGGLIDQMCGTLSQAVVPRAQGRPQPLHACYRASVLPFVEARLKRGALRMLELLDDLQVAWIDVAEPLININTPDDLTARPR